MSCRTLTHAEASKLIKQTLKEAFPDTTFNVRSSRYSGGRSVYVSWTDGPLTKDVEAITKRFNGRGFDGSTDSTYYNGPVTFRGELVEIYASVSASRNVSRDLLKTAAERVAQETGVAEPVISERGNYFEDRSTRVPYKFYPEEGVLSECSWDAEYLDQLIYQVSYATPTPHKVGIAAIPEYADEISQSHALAGAAVN